LKEALHDLYTMNNPLDSTTYDSILQVCIKKKALFEFYTRHGFAKEALRLFQQMQEITIKPEEFTFSSILPTCAKMGNLELGMELPSRILIQ
jgi:pentatricopeptide repeat protein